MPTMRHLLVLHPDPGLHKKARRAFENRSIRVHSARRFETWRTSSKMGWTFFWWPAASLAAMATSRRGRSASVFHRRL